MEANTKDEDMSSDSSSDSDASMQDDAQQEEIASLMKEVFSYSLTHNHFQKLAVQYKMMKWGQKSF